MSQCRIAGFALALVLGWTAYAGSQDGTAAASSSDKGVPLPKFTEEREAAALQFAKTHAPGLIPILDRLRISDQSRYRQEICEIFQATEYLGELQAADGKRFNLELEIWKTETGAWILIARLLAANEADKTKIMEDLQDQAKKLVDLDIQVLKLRIEELERELAETRQSLVRADEKRDTLGKERLQRLLDQARKRRAKP